MLCKDFSGKIENLLASRNTRGFSQLAFAILEWLPSKRAQSIESGNLPLIKLINLYFF